MVIRKIPRIVLLIKKTNIFCLSLSAYKRKFILFSQTAANNETRAGISLKYVIVSPSCCFYAINAGT